MKNRYLVAFAILASLSWSSAARAQSLGSKLTDAVSAAATAAGSETARREQRVTAEPPTETQGEALTSGGQDTATPAQDSSAQEQK